MDFEDAGARATPASPRGVLRFVLEKALQHPKMKPIVVINKDPRLGAAESRLDRRPSATMGSRTSNLGKWAQTSELWTFEGHSEKVEISNGILGLEPLTMKFVLWIYDT